MSGMDSLAGRRALVTGGSRGIGKAIASCLSRNGAEVTITKTSSGGEDRYHRVDFSCEKQLSEFCQIIADSRYDIVVNNAGLNRVQAIDEVDCDTFATIHKVNLEAALRITKAAVPCMREQGWGRIVNIASIWSQISRAGRIAYSASKFGLEGMTLAVAVEVAASNILCNCVSPGFVDTDLTRQTLGSIAMEKMADEVPCKRLAQPEEIAQLVLWLASPLNTYVTGQNIVIDGGFSRV